MFGHNLHHVTSTSGTKVTLALLAVGRGRARRAGGRRHLPPPPHRRVGGRARILQRAWFVDEIYQALIANPGRALSQWLASVFDAKVIDGAVNGVAALVRGGGTRLRAVQSGYVRSYALAVALGAVGILVFALTRSL